MTWFESTAAAALAAIFTGLVFYLARYLHHRLKLGLGVVRITLTDGVSLPSGWRLMLRHVRDGKDEVDDKGPLRNRDLPFTTGGSERFVKIEYEKTLGFQFKCYLDTDEDEVGSVKSWLDERGFEKIDDDETKQGRIWFLLPTAPRCKTVDGYINNYYHPNISEVLYEA